MAKDSWRNEIGIWSRAVLQSIEDSESGKKEMEEHFDPDDYYDLIVELIRLLEE